MGEPINTQPIAPKEKEANLLSSAVPDSLGTEREGGRRGRERGERGRERGREGERERERGRERAPYQHNQRLFPFAFSF